MAGFNGFVLPAGSIAYLGLRAAPLAHLGIRAALRLVLHYTNGKERQWPV